MEIEIKKDDAFVYKPNRNFGFVFWTRINLSKPKDSKIQEKYKRRGAIFLDEQNKNVPILQPCMGCGIECYSGSYAKKPVCSYCLTRIERRKNKKIKPLKKSYKSKKVL